MCKGGVCKAGRQCELCCVSDNTLQHVGFIMYRMCFVCVFVQAVCELPVGL